MLTKGADYLIKSSLLTRMAKPATGLGFLEPLDTIDFMAWSEDGTVRRLHCEEYDDLWNALKQIAIDRSSIPENCGKGSRLFIDFPACCIPPAFAGPQLSFWQAPLAVLALVDNGENPMAVIMLTVDNTTCSLDNMGNIIAHSSALSYVGMKSVSRSTGCFVLA